MPALSISIISQMATSSPYVPRKRGLSSVSVVLNAELVKVTVVRSAGFFDFGIFRHRAEINRCVHGGSGAATKARSGRASGYVEVRSTRLRPPQAPTRTSTFHGLEPHGYESNALRA